MKKCLNIILAATIIIIAAQPSVYSQWKPKTLNVALISKSVSIPFGQIVVSPLHPGIKGMPFASHAFLKTGTKIKF